MVLGLITHESDPPRRRDGPPDEQAGLTEEDLHRIRSVAETPRFRRTPEMLCPDEAPEEGAPEG